MAYFKERKGEDIIPIPTLEVTASRTLTADDEIILVNGPADDSPGFTPDLFSAEFTQNVADSLDSDIFSPVSLGFGNIWTASVWVRVTGTPGGSNEDRVFEFAKNGINSDFYRLHLRGEKFQVTVIASASSLEKEGTFGADITLNRWYNVTMVWDGTEAEVDRLKAYIDGSEESISFTTNDTGFAMANTSRHVRFGGPNGPPNAFGGQAHSGMIWDVALNAANITAVYNGGNGSGFNVQADSGNYNSSADLIHWWRLGFNGSSDPDLGEAAVGGVDLTTTLGTVVRTGENPGGTTQVTLTLPDAASNPGKSYTITDKIGAAASLAILISPTGSDTIDGASSDSLTLAKGSKTYFSDGISQWRVQGSTGTSGGTASTLQDAYDLGTGSVTTTNAKPFDVAGDLTVVTGTFSETLTVSGIPVQLAGGDIPDPLNITELIAVTGTFTTGLTVGGASTDIIDGRITTITGVFDELFLDGTALSVSPVEGFRGARVTTSSGIDVPHNTTVLFGGVPYDVVTFDTEDMYDGVSAFTIPAGINKIRVTTSVVWPENSTGERTLFATVDGVSRSSSRMAPSPTSETVQTAISNIVDVVEGDVIQAGMRQESGITLATTVNTELNMMQIEVIDPVATNPNDLSAISGTFSQSLTVSGIPVRIDGDGLDVDALTVSGGGDITGTIDFVGANGVNVSDSGNTITIDGQGIVAGGGGGGTLTDINTTATGPSVTVTGVGGINTITDGNTITVSGGQFAPAFQGARVFTSSGIDTVDLQTIGHPWDSVEFDTNGFFSASSNPNVFTIPTGVNRVVLKAAVLWTSNATGFRRMQFRKDPTGANTLVDAHHVQAAGGATGTSHVATFVSPIITVNAGEEYAVHIAQNSGGALSTITNLSTLYYYEIEVIDPPPAPGPNLTGKQAFRGAQVGTSSGIDNNAFLSLPWDTVFYDTDGFFQPGVDPTQLVIPAGVTRAKFTGNVRWASDTGGERSAVIVKRLPSGSSENRGGVRENANDTGNVHLINTVTAVLSVEEGETYELLATANGATSPPVEITSTIPSVSTYFSVEVVEDNEPLTFQNFVAATGTFTEITAVTGTFTEGLTIGGSSTHILPDRITTLSGIFTSDTEDALVVGSNPTSTNEVLDVRGRMRCTRGLRIGLSTIVLEDNAVTSDTVTAVSGCFTQTVEIGGPGETVVISGSQTGAIATTSGSFEAVEVKEFITVGDPAIGPSSLLGISLIDTDDGIFNKSLTVSGIPITGDGPTTTTTLKAAHLSTTSGISIPNSTSMPIPWDVAVLNDGDWFAHSFPNRLTVPAGVSRVRVTAGTRWEANATGARRAFITRNGDFSFPTPASGVAPTVPGSVIVAPPGAAAFSFETFTPVVEANEGDYFEVWVNQDSGTTLDIADTPRYDTFFAIEAVASGIV